ncbi:hypothetical protein MRX96_052506, partial [Rhipicephalus microplus]
PAGSWLKLDLQAEPQRNREATQRQDEHVVHQRDGLPGAHVQSHARNLDKLTVLCRIVQHIKTIRGSTNSYTEGHYKPSWLSDDDVKNVALQHPQGDILGQSWFDISHPKDIAKVKEQLSSLDLCPKERVINAKSTSLFP